MKKIFIKRLLSLIMMVIMVFPTLTFASSESNLIDGVYFQDENGDMVFVDYAQAIQDAMNGDFVLYNAIKNYVGIAEEKGKPLYLETDSGVVLDYSLSMIDSQFRLVDIIDVEKYHHDEEVEYSHELKIIDGRAEIVPTEEEGSNYIIDIDGPIQLNVEETGEFEVRTFGDNTGDIDYRAIYEYEITGGEGILEYLDGDRWRTIPLEGQFGPEEGFILTPDWDVTTEFRFTPNTEGTYNVSIHLVDLDADNTLAEDEYEVLVVSDRPIYIVNINPVESIEVEIGTTVEDAIAQLAPTTDITDSENITHRVDLDWTIEDYNGDIEGVYDAVGTFELPEGLENTNELDLEVRTTIEVIAPIVEDFPREVDNVTLGTSEITDNTYANINIKEEYVEDVDSVYVDEEEANQIENSPFQWRIQVAENTTVDGLRGRITVEGTETAEEPSIVARYRPHLIPTFGYVTIEVDNLEGAAKFDVLYKLSDGSEESTSIVGLGEEAGLIYYNTEKFDTVTIRIYDLDENLIYTFRNVSIVSS